MSEGLDVLRRRIANEFPHVSIDACVEIAMRGACLVVSGDEIEALVSCEADLALLRPRPLGTLLQPQRRLFE
jgi:hypothetical protein